MTRLKGKPCPLCGWPVWRGWKYCKKCGPAVREAMERSGYLTPAPYRRETEGTTRSVNNPLTRG